MALSAKDVQRSAAVAIREAVLNAHAPSLVSDLGLAPSGEHTFEVTIFGYSILVKVEFDDSR